MRALLINKSSLMHNLAEVRKEVGEVKLIGVVKGNGYGLDTLQFARTLLEGGVGTLATARLEDAVTLREGGIDSEILLLSPVFTPEQAALAVEHRLTCAIDSAGSALLLNTAGKEQNLRVWVHLKIDTGFGRYGFHPDCADEVKQILQGCEFLTVTGTFSHLSDAFGKSEKHTRAQFEKFQYALRTLTDAGIDPGMKHLANSCAALRFPYTRLDAVRIGSAFTGRLPVKTPARLEPVCRLACSVAEVKWLPKGANIGYANLYTTKAPTRIAVIPLGYADGLHTEKSRDTFRFLDVLRYLWNDFKRFFVGRRTYCAIGGKRARLLGRVCLTNCIADVTELECGVGDVAEFRVNPLMVDSSVERIYE